MGLDPKKVSTPVHGTDVLHSGRLGADEVDGVCDCFMEGADDAEGELDGADDGTDDVDGPDVGMTEGAEDGHPAPKMVDSSDPKSPPPSRMTSLS